MVEGQALQYWVDIVEPAVPTTAWWWYPVWLLAVLFIVGVVVLWLRRGSWYWYWRARHGLDQAIESGEVKSYLVGLERDLRNRPLAPATRCQLQYFRYAPQTPASDALQALLRDCRRQWRGPQG